MRSVDCGSVADLADVVAVIVADADILDLLRLELELAEQLGSGTFGATGPAVVGWPVSHTM